MKKYLVAFVLSLLGFTAFANADTQASTGASSAAKAGTAETAPLVLFSRPVFTFRAANQGISPHDRAKRARTRIHEQLTATGSHVVSLKADTVGIQVHIDGATSFFITPQDLDPGREDNLEQTARQAATALTLAINESMESRSLESLMRALGAALAATALYAALVWGAARAQAALAKRLVGVTERHSEKLHLGGVALFQRERLVNAVQLAITLAYRLLVLVLTMEWVSFVMRSFPFTRAWGESMNRFLLDLALPVFSSALGAVPELLTAVLIFYLCYITTHALDRFLAKVQSGQVQLQWLDADTAVPTQRIAKVVLWLFALAMAYPYLPGSDTEAFKGLSVLVGLMLSNG